MTDTKAPPAIDRDDGWHLEPAGRRNGASWRAGIDATGAWRQLMEVAGAGVARGGRGVRVVVLDTGMDVDHPALKHAVVRELARDFDHSADRDGRSLADGGRVHNRYDAHGTACAGIIAAHDPENSQIAGIAPGCTIVPVRISNNFDPNALVHAVNYARQKGDVILLPRAMPEWIEPAGAGGQPAVLTEQESQWKSELDRLRQALTDAAKEVPVVCPSGNNGTKQIGYPASIPGMIVVGACNELGYHSTYSQYGEGLDIVAPSNDVATEDRSIVRLTRAEAFRRFEERETEAVEQEVAESLAGLSRPRPAQAAAPETRGLSEAKAPPYRAAETGDRDPGVQAEQAFADVYERSLEGLAEIEADLDGLRQRREDFLAAHGVDRLGTLFIATTDNSGASGYLPDGKDDYSMPAGRSVSAGRRRLRPRSRASSP
jgi:hypothetical protein